MTASPLPPGHTRPAPAPPLTADEAAVVARFDAAGPLLECAPITRAVLALAEELDAEGAEALGDQWDQGVAWARGDTCDRLRATVAAVLAADPEPRAEKVERMARALEQREAELFGRTITGWDELPARWRDHYRRLAAAAIGALE